MVNETVQIGPMTLDAPFFQAGLAGYSDAAMRLVARRHGCPYCVTEAMLDQFLISGGKGLKAAELDDDDHPIAGQLMGSHPKEIAEAAHTLLGLGYDAIDINLACPVKKIRKKCRGGHLLSAPDDAMAIIDAVRQVVAEQAPCTLKLRRGTDDSARAETDFQLIFEHALECGYAAIVVHGRSVQQKYEGPARWSFLRRLVDHYGEVEGLTIGGSGDIWQASDIFRMRHETGVDLVSVARGCIGNPWLFAQARAVMAGDVDAAGRPPRIAQQRQVLLDHFGLSIRRHGERAGSIMMRKFGIKFSIHHPDHQIVRQAFIAVHDRSDWQRVLDERYAEDGPGRAADTQHAHTGSSSQPQAV